MPKAKRSKKAPPEGWELIEPTLDELDAKMREGNCSKCCFLQYRSYVDDTTVAKCNL